MSDNALILAARESLVSYGMLMDKSFMAYPHIKIMAEALQACKNGTIKRLIIQAPPRHGKTTTIGNILPAWLMGHFPEKKMFYVTNTAARADKEGAKVRELIKNPLHAAVFGKSSQLTDYSTAKRSFKINGGGTYLGIGAMGSFTGEGANILIVDDPFESPEEAKKSHVRESMKDWYQSTLYNRMEKDAVLIIMHQRLHDDDLAGWLQREHKFENWTVVNLPAISHAELPDSMGREAGLPLCPELKPLAELERIRQVMHPLDWLSQYQQTPQMPSGGEFKKTDIQYYSENPFDIGFKTNRFLLVDPATSKRKDSDYTAMVVIGLGADENYYLLDGVYDHLNLQERTKLLFDLHRKWKKPRVGYEQYGAQADIEHIKYVQAQEMYRFPIQQIGGTMAKLERIRRLVPIVGQRRLYLPSSLIYTTVNGNNVDLTDLMVNKQLIPFPVMTNDDFIDAFSRIQDMPLSFPNINNHKHDRQQDLAGV